MMDDNRDGNQSRDNLSSTGHDAENRAPPYLSAK